MSDSAFSSGSLSLSRQSTLEETITSLITTTTINTVMTHEEEQEERRRQRIGRNSGSSYYSTSSASSSAENVSSSIDTGELLVFTFMSSQRSSSFPSSSSSSSSPPTTNPPRQLGSMVSWEGCCCNTSSSRTESHLRPSMTTTMSSSTWCNNCHKNPPTRYGRPPTPPLETHYPRHNPEQNGTKFTTGTTSTRGDSDFHHSSSTAALKFDGSHKYSYKSNNSAEHNNYSILHELYRIIPYGSPEGTLVQSMEKGVLFPVIHWSAKSADSLSPVPHLELRHSPTAHQGIYKELKRVIPPDSYLRSDIRPDRGAYHQTWIVIGYKSLEKKLDSSLEATWKEWTGARHIYLNLRHDFEIRKISFFIRLCPDDNLDLFMYLVLMEVGNVHDSNMLWLLDFIQRTRVERMKGFINVYAEVDHRRIRTIEDEYARYVRMPSESCRSTSTDSDSGYRNGYDIRMGQSSNFTLYDHHHNQKHNGSGSPVKSRPPIQPIPKTFSSTMTRNISTHNYTEEPADSMPLVEATLELNGNLQLIEKLLKEIHEPIGNSYF